MKGGFFNRYMHLYIPSNLDLSIERTVGYNNKILISNTGMKIRSNRNVNKTEVYHREATKSQSPEVPCQK